MILTNVMIVTLIYLLIIVLLDLKYKQIPALITWSFILINLILSGINGIYGGCVMLVLGLLLMDYSDKINFFEGGADLKVLVAIGISLSSTLLVLIYIPLMLFFGLIYKISFKYSLNKSNDYEVAFIPVFVASYIALLLGVSYLL